MQRKPPVSAPPVWLEPQLEVVLDAFDEAWSTGVAPNLKAFHARGKHLSPTDRGRLLIELIKVDLEYRWRFFVLPERGSKIKNAVSAPRMLEDYLQDFPDLIINAELAAEEWLVRNRFGDRPSRSEYLRRFERLGVALLQQFQSLEPEMKGSVTTAASGAALLPGTPLDWDPAPTAAHDPHLWLGRYQVARQLGKGSFGLVFLAKDPRLDRQVVIKLLHEEANAVSPDRQHLLREARLAGGMRHPGLVTIYDVVFEEGRCAVIMEYVAGGTLGERLAQGETTRLALLEWIAAVADALHAAHTAGLVHRALKPANILLDAWNRPKVADLGLALLDRRLKPDTSQVAGAPAYMAPEQVRGDNRLLDGRTDIWSLGVILYEALTRERPFTGNSLDELFSQIEFGEPQSPRQLLDSIDPELERICLKCLAKSVTSRYATACDLADDLRRYLARATARNSIPRSSDAPRPQGQATGVQVAPVESRKMF